MTGVRGFGAIDRYPGLATSSSITGFSTVTGILVITDLGGSSLTGAGSAFVFRLIGFFAAGEGVILHEDTGPIRGITTIRRAFITVVARLGCPGLTLAVGAGLKAVAGIGVITRNGFVNNGAIDTLVGSTGIPIIHLNRGIDLLTIHTGINGATVVVINIHRCVGDDTILTGIGGAGITVIG